jgi:hypothetical protein
MTRTTGFFLPPGTVQVVGMSGQARSGKDYLAGQVLQPLGFLPTALANHFKITAISKGLEGLPADAVDIRQLWETDKDELHRQALQLEGTERGRDVHGPDIWCRHLEAWMYYYHLKGYRRFVVTDVRFINEVEWIKRLGGKVYRVIGRGGLDGSLLAHRSERDLDQYPGFDRIIDNSRENEHMVIHQLRTAVVEDFIRLAA